MKTADFKNTSSIPDSTIHDWISFILEGGRLPSGCKVVIEQGRNSWGSGRAWGAYRSSSFYRGRATVKGGKIYMCAPSDDKSKATIKTSGHGGYLPRRYFGRTERAFAVLAHEIRHVFQGVNPLSRECRRVRKHVLGTCGKLREVDACLFEIRALRRFRRDYATPSLAILPLP